MSSRTRTRGHAALTAATAAGVLISSVFATAALADGRGDGWGKASPLLRTDGVQVPGGCPIESPAGTFLFTARNPGTGLDIYVNQRAAADGPFNPGSALPAPVNDANLGNDFCPTPVPDNGLYFVSNRSGGCGDSDMYSSVQNPSTGWSEPVNLGCHPDGPNTPGAEFSPSVIYTAWGTYLYFSTDFHTGNQDIYWSQMRDDGTFGPAVRLGWPINTEYDDRQPNVSQDGREIVFASDRPSAAGDATGFDIFYAKRPWPFVRWQRAVNLSESVPFDTVNTSETRPSMSWDRKRLVYGSGGVWISERKH